MYIWLLLCVVLLSCLYIVILSFSWRAKKLYAHLPSYPCYPIVGNLHKMYGSSTGLYQIYNEVTKIIEKTNKPFIFWAGPVPAIVISDPDEIRMAANAFVDKPYYYNFARVWLGDGLVTAPGSIWKKNVKRIASTFIGPYMDNYQVVFNEHAKRLVNKLQREVDKGFFDSMPYFSLSTMEAICHAGLGVSKSDSLVTDEYYKSFNRTLELLVHRSLNVFLHLDPVYWLTSAYKELVQCVSVLHSVSVGVMKERLLDRQMNNNTGDTKHKEGFKPFLDVMLDWKDQDPSLTEKQILAEIDTIILAGQETVATTLFYVLLLVGSRKDVQDTMYKEIMRVVGDRREVLTEDLWQLEYCEGVLNESLRVLPPVVGVLRYADRDLQMKSCTIAKGSNVVLNMWGASRSPRWWGPDAAEFKPERWLPPNTPCTSAHLPFSTGKRACIGKKYAMAFLKTILVHMIREYEIISEDTFNQMEFKLDIALRPLNGYFMKIRRRVK